MTKPTILAALFALAATLSSNAATATSVTQRNVTWNFDTSYTVGQYANGDWWVVGPVTITSIDPASATTGNLANGSAWWKNGTEVNPTARGDSAGGGSFDSGGVQGFDNSMTEGTAAPSYSAALNVDPGYTGSSLVVSEGTVVKSISRTTIPSQRSGGDKWPQVEEMEYLTVVTSEPAASSFRPPPVGSDKTSLWTTNDLNWSIIRDLTVLSGAPALSTVESQTVRPWPSFMMDNRGRWTHPRLAMPNYGRDFGRRIGNAGLVLHSDVGDKTTLFIQMVQIGIDTAATVDEETAKGGVWMIGFGGIQIGWKFPALLAGLALNDTNILYNVSGGVTTPGSAPSSSRLKFSFDRQTWYVLESDVGRVMYNGDGKNRETYSEAHVGAGEWGEQHWYQQYKDDSRWGASYRSIAFSGAFSGILAALLTDGGEAAWGWPATIDYFDRYMAEFPSPVDPSFGANRLSQWESDMYNAYRDLADSGGSAPVISSEASSSITSDAATVSWATDVAVNQHGIRYGTTTAFGSTATNTATTTLNPSFDLTSLSAATTYYWQPYSTLDGNTGAGVTNSFATLAAPIVSTPTFSIAAGSWIGTNIITLSSATSGATIYYSTTGIPTTNSTEYTSPIVITDNTTIQAFATKSGLTDSIISSANYYYGPWSIELDEFGTVSFDATTNDFSIYYTVSVGETNSDAVIAVGDSADASTPVTYSDFPVLIRFNTDGEIDVRYAGYYSNDVAVAYQTNTVYTLRADIDVSAKTYDVFVNGQQIASDYAFRTDKATEDTFDHVGFSNQRGLEYATLHWAGFSSASNQPARSGKRRGRDGGATAAAVVR